MQLDTTAIRIIKDLTEKFPVGPKRSIRKHHYRMVNEWVFAYKRTTQVPVIRPEVGEFIVRPEWKPYFGYDPVDLYKLGLIDESECIKAIRIAYPEASRIAQTRDGRRLWIRISPARDWVRCNGTTGLWCARYTQAQYGTTLYGGITFHASSRAEVEARISMIAPMLGEVAGMKPDVSFIAMGSPDDAMSRNSAAVEAFTKRQRNHVAELEKSLKKARTELEEAEMNAGKLMGAIMLGASDTEEEEPETSENAA